MTMISMKAASRIIPFIPSYAQYFQTSSSLDAVQKLLLSNLRKKTGISISQCKKALEIYENDFQKAEEWLVKEAQAQGWAKATKLSGRATTQGLIGIHIERNVGGLVEVNCETDFVARNYEFQTLVSKVAKEFTLCDSSFPGNLEEPIKECYDKERLDGIKSSDGKTLSDHVALVIGKIGENLQLSRGVKFISPPGFDLVGYTHPQPPKNVGLLGRYGAVVAFKNTSNSELVRQLCAHIVGMNPKEIGSLDDVEEDVAAEIVSLDDPEGKKGAEIGSEDPEGKKGAEIDSSEDPEGKKASEMDFSDDLEEKVKTDAEEEMTLVRQMFLSDGDTTVGKVLKENDIQIIDFVRLECGETRTEASAN